MIALETERRALAGLQVAVPADVARVNCVTRCTQAHVPAARHLRRFAEVQRNLPAAYRTAAAVGDIHVQLVAAAPHVRIRHRAGDSTSATARTRTAARA